MSEEQRSGNRPILIGLGVLAVGAAISIGVRWGSDTAIAVDAAMPIFSASKIEPTVLLDDAEPVPDFVMTSGDDSNVDLSSIDSRTEEIARCLDQDRACVTLTHARGAIVGAIPEGDVDAGPCIVSALEGSRLDENAPPTVRICITRTRR